jgi:Protein of unknown function (DUF3352)
MTDMTNAPMLDPLPLRPAGTRRPRLWRSVLAFLVSVSLLLAMTGVAVFAQTGASGGPNFVPATAIAYGEVRLDLPGDQHDQLAAFMAHFPGFADPSSFDTKLSELLDQALSSSTGGALTWSGNIQTWSNGDVGLGLLSLPTTAGADPSVVIGVGVRDRAALETQLSTMVGTKPVTTLDYAGATITTAGNASYAVTDTYLLISPAVADVQTSLDVLGGTVPSLATNADYQAARATQPADDLGSFYVSVASLKPFIDQMLSGQSGAGMILDQLVNLPVWVGGYAQVADDHLALGFSTKLATSGMLPTVRATDLAAHFPADTLAYVELHDLGTTLDTFLGQIKTQLSADPKDSEQLAQVEQQFGTTLDKLFDVVDDGAVGIGFDGQQLSAGIVATLNDPAVGGARIQKFLGLLRLLGGSLPVDITSADVNGTTVTTITLQQAAGTPTNLPFTPAVSIAVSDGHLYIGLGDFAATALAQDPQSSLATDPRYSAAVTEAGAPNAAVIWVDVAAAAPLLVQMAGADDASYETNVKPWVDALDYFVATATVDGDIASLKALLFVK